MPFLNGLLDFTSWFVSRKLAEDFQRKIASTNSGYRLIRRAATDGGCDIAAALVLLLLLTFLLGLTMEIVRLEAGWSGSVVAEIERAAADPFG